MHDHEKSEEHVEDLEVPEQDREDVNGGVLIGLLLPAVQKAPPEVGGVHQGRKIQPGGSESIKLGGPQ